MTHPIRLAILECDTPVPNVKAKCGGYGAIFITLLTAGAKAENYVDLSGILSISTFNVVDNPDSYPSLDKIDAVLLTGSKHDSFENDPWIEKLVDFVAHVIDQKRIKLIGVCFGHQIIARAMGVRVGRNRDGWEVAVNDVELSEKGKEIFGLSSGTLHIHQMHKDIVFEYPDNVESLGSSPVCSVQGFYRKNQILTVQGHPEFNLFIMNEIIETRHKMGVFDQEVYQEYIKKAPLDHDGVVVSRAFLRFLQKG